MRSCRHFLPFLFVLFIIPPANVSGQTSPEITSGELQKHVKYLASDELEGRRVGTKEANAAASYIAKEFKAYGLEPLGKAGSYYQDFDFISGVMMDDINGLSFTVSRKTTYFKPNKDYRPLGFSASTSFSGKVVFAGYGISDSAKQYDDYSGVDVKGKAVLVLQGAPPSDSARGLQALSSARYKAAKAQEFGAKALILVTADESPETESLEKMTYESPSGEAGILAVTVTRKAANAMLQSLGMSVTSLRESIKTSKSQRSASLPGIEIGLTVTLKEIVSSAHNVVGKIAGNDPELKNQIMVIGAHYDHLGSEQSNGSISGKPVIFHGADDNASGTAGLLELAQSFSAGKSSLRRSVLFIAFSGEEEGVLGSTYYVKHPLVPLEKTVAMLNMDMIGRLRSKRLIVNGVGTSPGFEALARKHNTDTTFVLSLTPDGYGSSDQSPFYTQKLPVLFFFTDVHPDYHRPSDTWDKINYAGMKQVDRYVYAIAADLDTVADKPSYVAVEAPRQQSANGGSRVYVGTVPDFGEQVQGMKLSGVRDGSPAAQAGILAGDIIVKFGKVDVKSLYDFTYAIGGYKPGDEVEVVVKRGNEQKTVRVVLEQRSN